MHGGDVPFSCQALQRLRMDAQQCCGFHIRQQWLELRLVVHKIRAGCTGVRRTLTNPTLKDRHPRAEEREVEGFPRVYGIHLMSEG